MDVTESAHSIILKDNPIPSPKAWDIVPQINAELVQPLSCFWTPYIHGGAEVRAYFDGDIALIVYQSSIETCHEIG